MSDGTVVAIFVTDKARAPMQPVPRAQAVPGKGLEGDRYFSRQGTFFRDKPLLPDKEVTLIEQEALDALARDYHVELEPHETRRNILTKGVALNHLVGREFTVGKARLRGLRLCEPCGHLERLNGRKLIKGLTHRGGLRAQIVTAGAIAVSDPIVLHADLSRLSTEFLDYVRAVSDDCMGGAGH
jgi:MOSC domain-containing protein YiiM